MPKHVLRSLTALLLAAMLGLAACAEPQITEPDGGIGGTGQNLE